MSSKVIAGSGHRHAFWLGLLLASASLTNAVHAHGPSATTGVFFPPNDNQSLYVRTTFGLLISHDDGCSFRWVCEENIGYGGTFEPTYAIAADGTVFATSYGGLRVSRDGGCSFTTATAELPIGAPGRIADIWVDAVDIGAAGEIWVGTSDTAGSNEIYRSIDGGVTFVSRGLVSPALWDKTLVVAPSDAMHVYVAGYQVANGSQTAHVFSTANGGDQWTEASLTGVQFAGKPEVTVAAVDRANKQHLYIVSVGANGTDGDRLYRSTDGGVTFAEVLATTQPIVDVVIDATTVFVVSGDGTFRSDDSGASFGAAATAPKLGCLGKRSDGTLIGCATNWDPDFMAVGRSTDASQWQKVFRFVELAGPVVCPPGTAGFDVCDQQGWPIIQERFGATGPTCGATTDLPVEDGDRAGGGCCDAGNGSPIGLALTMLAAWLIGLRRRSIPAA
jgi:hypothetical protein